MFKLKKLTGALSALALICSSAALHAITVVDNEKTKMDIGGRFQIYGIGQFVDDADAADDRYYMFLRQARFNMTGTHEKVKFGFQAAFAGEEEVKAPSPGVTLSLLDMYADAPLFSGLRFRVGQFKIPYSRERLTDSKDLQFTDRSLSNLAFRHGRDAGGAFHGTFGIFQFALGMFTGGGRDIPERYLPQQLGGPMGVIRLGISNGPEADIFDIKQGVEVNQLSYGVFINALYTRDSSVGHSTVITSKLAEKSLVLNTNWNPYIGMGPRDRGEWRQGGLDFVIRQPIAGITMAFELEGNFAQYKNNYGELNVPGGRAQVSATKKPMEFALRYSAFRAEPTFGYFSAGKIYPIFDGRKSLVQEVTPSFTWFFQDNFKLIFDVTVWDVPVAHENGIGVYVLSQQPDQVTYISSTKNQVYMETVEEFHVMMQYTF